MGPRLASFLLLGCLLLVGARWLVAQDAAAPKGEPTIAVAAAPAGSDPASLPQGALPATPSPFRGRVLAVYSASDPEAGGAILVEVKTAKLGEQSFLVGKCPDMQDPSEWRAERTVWLSLSDIAQIVEFDNVEQYRKAVEKAGLNDPGL